jgi:SAM-dependent methyltransferase
MASLFLSNVEYVTLRLVRRFLFPTDLQRIGRYLPFYRTNVAEVRPEYVCELYRDALAENRLSIDGGRVLEVGSGATNGVGYALACAGASRVWCIEPFVPLDRALDIALLARAADQHGVPADSLSAIVQRCDSFASVGAAQADLILSHSVLEHLADPAAVFSEMKSALSRHGVMLHVVDYRDHFFKYPLHFLQFSRTVWQRFLNPGDLPRWRLNDHVTALRRAGFDVTVLRQVSDARELERIRPHISSDFDANDATVGVLQAVLLCSHNDVNGAKTES